MAFSQLFKSTNLEIILVHETICSCSQVVESFSKFLLGWEFYAVDSIGMFGGLLLCWNPSVVDLKDFYICGGIFMEGKFKGQYQLISILNCYGSYKDSVFLGNSLEASDLLSFPNLIVVKDVNFTMVSTEIWGNFARSDPHSKFYKYLLFKTRLVDALSMKLGST